jgi:two-component system chemotaxis response regulator CheB
VDTIKIVVVDDSSIVQLLLEKIISQQQDMEIVGQAHNGSEGIALVKKLSPNVVVMDINMPGMDGLEAIQEIMSDKPTPIIVFSSASAEIVDLSFKSIELGAVDIIEKPFSKDYQALRLSIEQKLLRTIKTFSNFKVIRRLRKTTSTQIREKAERLKTINERMHKIHPPAPVKTVTPEKRKQHVPSPQNFCVVGIAASTGGPQTIKAMVEDKRMKDINAGIVIVQHIAEGFVEGFHDWLKPYSQIPVEMALQGHQIKPNHIYIAPGGCHLGISRQGKFHYLDDPPIFGIRPSANILFKYMAEIYKDQFIAVILTGMGNDGIDSLNVVKQNGGFVLAQDKESSILYGMPKAAVEAGFADKVLPLAEIPDFLSRICAERESDD